MATVCAKRTSIAQNLIRLVWRFVDGERRKRRRRLTAAAVTEEVLDSSPTPGPQADNKSADSLTEGGIEMDNTQIQQLNRLALRLLKQATRPATLSAANSGQIAGLSAL
ncbi:MAG: hypothetical protein IPI48_06250 [bacterium]|nr:hypothetical protein [bacterium]